MAFSFEQAFGYLSEANAQGRLGALVYLLWT